MEFWVSKKAMAKAVARGEAYMKEHPESLERGRKMIEDDKLKNPIPHCPLCGTDNIRRISSSAKVGNTLAFGIYGNKRKKQFECLNPNCRYKF